MKDTESLRNQGQSSESASWDSLKDVKWSGAGGDDDRFSWKSAVVKKQDEVIERNRKQEDERLKNDPRFARMIKGMKWDAPVDEDRNITDIDMIAMGETPPKQGTPEYDAYVAQMEAHNLEIDRKVAAKMLGEERAENDARFDAKREVVQKLMARRRADRYQRPRGE